MEVEEWKDIKGYEGLYQVSNLGRVKRMWKTSSRICREYPIGGYIYVSLSKGGADKKVRLHRIVAEAFIPNPYNLPEVNHKNEDKTNNKADNLEWCTREYNQQYGTRSQRITESMTNNSKTSKAVQCVETGIIYPSVNEAGRSLGISASSVSKCCRGCKNYKTVGGYHWRYINK